MKVFYVPFNNRGIGVETYEESGFMEELLQEAGKCHIEDDEKGTVFLYVSEADSGFVKVFSKQKWPAWLVGINMVVRRNFDTDEGDRMALELADGDSSNVIVFKPYPCGLLTHEEVIREHNVLKEKWGWGYVAPIEKEHTHD